MLANGQDFKSKQRFVGTQYASEYVSCRIVFKHTAVLVRGIGFETSGLGFSVLARIVK